MLWLKVEVQRKNELLLLPSCAQVIRVERANSWIAGYSDSKSFNNGSKAENKHES